MSKCYDTCLMALYFITLIIPLVLSYDPLQYFIQETSEALCVMTFDYSVVFLRSVHYCGVYLGNKELRTKTIAFIAFIIPDL